MAADTVTSAAFLTGDVTVPAATLFEASTRLAAYVEMFRHLEKSDPSTGLDDDGYALGLLGRVTGEFPEDDAAYDQHEPLVAFEAAVRDRAAALLRKATESGYCILRDDDVTDRGLVQAAKELEDEASEIRESGRVCPWLP